MATQTTPQSFHLQHEKPKSPKQQKYTRAMQRAAKEQQAAKRMYYEAPAAREEETWFRHTHWAAKRAKVLATLEATGISQSSKTAFLECGAECYVMYCKETTRYKLVGSYCHNRHCEPCARSKANLLAANLRERLAQNPEGRYRFITLTLAHSAKPLREQIVRLYACFNKLRKSKLWQASQRGGCAILEVKWKDKTRRWHPHLHIVAEGEFMRQEDLAKAWKKITVDSFMVDIRSISTGKDAAHYVAKYVGKGTNSETWMDTDAAQEWVIAMRGVRTAATFGTWRGYKLLQHTPDNSAWVLIGSLCGIVKEAREGNDFFVRLLDTLAKEKQHDPGRKRKEKSQIS